MQSSGSETTPKPPIALVGSGEFLPQMAEVDRSLLNGRSPRVAILATAAGEEGQASVNRWLALGEEHFMSLGVMPISVPIFDRDSANDPALAALIADVGLVYLSGGNPGYLANSLRGTLAWTAIVDAWRAGAALAGCSAGAMALSATAPTVRSGTMTPHDGLSLVPHLSVMPHFDQMGKWDPGFVERARSQVKPGQTLVGIDEDTALVGGYEQWTVMGKGTVSVFSGSTRARYSNGDSVTLAIS
jgi:cyanophycinase